MNKRNRDNEITYEQLIAGALLKFDSIDNIDFSLLVDGFEKQTNIDIWGWYHTENIGKYVKCEKKGNISLKEGMTLDYFIKEENCTLQQKFIKVAGIIVKSYFDNFDIEKYKKEKEETLNENKKRVLNEANILLISDIQDDYGELIKYGFKNVNYFKSIIRADKYFAEHPEELEKYHIILKGNQNVQHCCFEGDVKLDRTIDLLRDEKHILEVSLFRYDYPDHMELVSHLNDRHNHRSWNTNEFNYSDLFDRIVENAFINHTLDTVDLKFQKFSKYEDYINPNRLPLPTKKENLKILYLDSVMVSKFAKQISEELGLNIDFKEDTNSSLGKYVKSHLGDYDIIIVSDTYSSNLLRMNIESTEQCKDTGRELTLLVSYDDIHWGIRDLADGVKLNYRFGGNVAPDSNYHTKEFRVLRYSVATEEDDEYWRKNSQSSYTKMRSIIEASVNFYNQALIENEKSTIADLDLKSADQLDDEYVSYIEALEAKKEAELVPIKVFDDIASSISIYLQYKKEGLITQIPEGLKITEGKDGIKFENIFQGRTLCAIVFPKENNKKNLRVFEIQTLSKKGTLSSPQTIAVYTSEYDNVESIPNRPDEKQQSALTSIQKKINAILKPLNEGALKKYIEQETQVPKTLNLKRKNNKKRRNY